MQHKINYNIHASMLMIVDTKLFYVWRMFDPTYLIKNLLCHK